MKKHISTAVVFFTSLMGLVFLGMPFFAVPNGSGGGISTMSGYDYLKEDLPKGFPDKMVSSYEATKVAVILLIVLFSVAVAYCVVKLLVDLKVIKVKDTYCWTEWVNVCLVTLIVIACAVALGGVSGFIAEWTKLIPGADKYLSVGYGVISALVVYCLVWAVQVAWSVIETLMQQKANKK